MSAAETYRLEWDERYKFLVSFFIIRPHKKVGELDFGCSICLGCDMITCKERQQCCT